MQQENPDTTITAFIQQLKEHGASKIGGGFQGIILSSHNQAYKIINHQYPYWRQLLLPLFQNEINLYKTFDFKICTMFPPFFERNAHQNGFWFSTALMNKGDLWKALRINKFDDHPLHPGLIIGIFFELNKILQFLHQRNIYHYDIKPENILLNQDYGLFHKQDKPSIPYEEAIVQLARRFNQDLNTEQIKQLTINNEPDYITQQNFLGLICNDQETMEFHQIRYRATKQELAQLLHLVEYATQRQNFHHDNICIRRQLQLVLCDFGFASSRVEMDGRGTNFFKAPFIILSPQYDQTINPQDIAKQCDLFSFGMSIFYLLWKSQNLQIQSYFEYTQLQHQILQEEIKQQNPGFVVAIQSHEQAQQLFLYWKIITYLRKYDQRIPNQITSLISVLLKLITFDFRNTQNLNNYAESLEQVNGWQKELLKYIAQQQII